MKSIKGNLVTMARDGVFDYIVHGCNCHCVMGSGIAPQIAEAFDGVIGPRQVDDMSVIGDREKLGTYTVAAWMHPETYHPVIIFNAYTQYDIATSPGDAPIDYDAVRSCFKMIGEALSKVAHSAPPRLGYPKIGAGLAGGDWDIISAIIDEELGELDHTLVEWDGT